VLGQSLSPGWRATLGSRDLGAPQLVDGYANGWLVAPTSAGFDVSLAWTAQSKVWIGLAISALVLLGCLLVVLRPGRLLPRRSRPGRSGARPRAPAPLGADAFPRLTSPLARDAGPLPVRRGVVAALAAGGLAAAFVTPLAGVAVLGATVLALLVRRGRTLVRVGAVALFAVSAAYVLEVQARYDLPETSAWAQAFHRVATLSWVAVALLVADVLVGWARRDAPSATSRVDGDTDRPRT
jgi:hypothetical protein